MKPVTPPPIKEPGDTIVAKLHVWVNGIFEHLPDIGIALLLAAAPRRRDASDEPVDAPD